MDWYADLKLWESRLERTYLSPEARELRASRAVVSKCYSRGCIIYTVNFGELHEQKALPRPQETD